MMRKYFFLPIFLYILFSQSSVIAQIKSIDFEREIQEYDTLRFCEIINYAKGKLFIKPINAVDTLSIKIATKQHKIDLTSRISGSIPSNGDTVLILFNKKSEVSLMAKKWDNIYFRFWSPVFQSPIFEYKRPGKNINGFSEKDDFKKDNYSCDDGCLYPVDFISKSYSLNGPEGLFLDSLNLFGVKLSLFEPAVGLEMKVFKKFSIS